METMQQLLEDVHHCPITYEIPFDPVLAEDGIVYERWAINEWFHANPGGHIRSPVTNVMIRKNTYPARQLRNMIRFLAEKGQLTGHIAEQWEQRFQEEKAFHSLKEQANGGDIFSMIRLSQTYMSGSMGVQKDPKMGFHWARRASDRGDVMAMSQVGTMYTNGYGVQKNLTLGVHYLTRSAELGSEYACHQLGFAFVDGTWGLGCDKQMAHVYLTASMACKVRNGSSASRVRAHNIMAELGTNDV